MSTIGPTGGLTNVYTLTFACAQHHKLIRPGGWKTRKRKDGSTEWLPLPPLPLTGGTNDFHHPERLLAELAPDPELIASAIALGAVRGSTVGLLTWNAGAGRTRSHRTGAAVS